MFVLAKLGCRIFQLAFRAALPFLPYREPEIIHSCSELLKIANKEKLNSILIVTDRGIIDNGLTASIEETFRLNKVKYVIYDKTKQNPTVKNVEEALKLYIDNNCNGLLAIGGGSSMDLAKAIGARVVYPNKSVEKLRGVLRVLKKLPTIIAIPTTAGTGSETTLAAVITDSEKHHKYALMSFPLIPHYAVLDTIFVKSLPESLTAETGMDALTHAVEAYIGRSTTKQTRNLALNAVKLVYENIEISYKDGNNLTARQNMLMASHMAGIAFSKSYVGYVHAVAHSLGGQYGTRHGLANAVILPYVLEIYGESIYKKLYELAVYANIAQKEDTIEAAAKKFIAAIKKLNSNMGIPDKIDVIQKSDISSMAKHAANEANPLYPVPVLLSKKEIENIYYKIGDWSEI